MKKEFKLIFFLGVLFLANLSFCSAYIDPGTGVAIVSNAWVSFVAAMGVFLAFIGRVFIQPIKRFFVKIWKFIKRK